MGLPSEARLDQQDRQVQGTTRRARILADPRHHLDLDIQVVDIVGAHLNGKLREEIYMQQPPMYKNGTSDVCQLHRTLYGLRQSGHEWNIALDGAFKSLNFTRLISDQCVYLCTRNSDIALVAVHVDDMTLLTSSPQTTDALKQELAAHFELFNLGPIRQVVGLEVSRNRATGTLALRKSQYIDRILARFGMANAKPVNTPLDVLSCAGLGGERGGENESCDKSEDATSVDPNRRPTLEERGQMSEMTKHSHNELKRKVETSGLYARSGLYQETRI
ncbi:hypothetical protein NUW54_g3514 [Trametes sanguinea]|uniref:Uncharacterized protein n=1 Tax=Trametes sanguinea TaxID=158606 RepID=A0ACC1Q2P7_9APHY|nr:hypothetical protein NUW54_g3514 [Trametes sanguinea]